MRMTLSIPLPTMFLLLGACSGGGGGGIAGGDGGVSTTADAQLNGTYERVVKNAGVPDTFHRFAFANGVGARAIEQALQSGRVARTDCFDYEWKDASTLRLKLRFALAVSGETETKVPANGAVHDWAIDKSDDTIYTGDLNSGSGKFAYTRVATPTPESLLEECRE